MSIVIPSFNQAAYLPACVDRCLFQTWPDLEIIIVDGGSTDGTQVWLETLEDDVRTRTVEPVSHVDEAGNIVREKQLVFPQNRVLKILCFDHDIGATRTYNEGFRKATGDYVTYIVGDDLPHPHMIEELAAALETTGADFVYSDMDLVDDDGRILRQIRLPDYSFEESLMPWFRLGVSHLYLREWHEKAGLMDEKNYRSANDYDHYLRFAMAGARFYHLNRILYSVRHHGENRKTGQHTGERYNNLLRESVACAIRAREWFEKQ